jgi:hypothetical protein
MPEQAPAAESVGKNKSQRHNSFHSLFRGGVVLAVLVCGQSVSFRPIAHKMGGETSPWRAKWTTITARLAAKLTEWLRDAGSYKLAFRCAEPLQ